MAAGSVINEPSKGTSVSVTHKNPTDLFTGSKAVTRNTKKRQNSKTGLLAAMIMITKTNSGSVKFSFSR